MGKGKRVNVEEYLTQNVNACGAYSSSRKTYKQHVRQFIHYLNDQGKPKRMNQERILKECQEYVKHLEAKGQSPHTVHTAISALASGTKHKLNDIGKVDRTLSTRGRVSTGRRTEGNERICEFAAMVGIRRAEYAKLTGSDIKEKDGDTYVIVRRGKGGKYQEQLIAPGNAEAVKSYFEGRGPNERIFSKEEAAGLHNANVHALRRANAQKMYRYYEAMDVRERAVMVKKIKQRFADNPKKVEKINGMMRSLYSPYYVRNKELAQSLKENGFDRKLDRFALMAVAVFHLSHYRVNVVVHNYLR